MRWDLTVVTDGKLRPDRSHLDVCRAALAGGANIVQFRDKLATDRAFLAWARELKQAMAASDALLVINDRVAVAAAIRAAVHLGQNDLPIGAARRLLPPRTIIGLTVSSAAQAVAAESAGADYLGVSPIFDAQHTKSDAGAPFGLGLLRRIRVTVDLPLIAIGGITVDNAADVIAAGADGVAVVSHVVCADDMVSATRALAEVVHAAKTKGTGFGRY